MATVLQNRGLANTAFSPNPDKVAQLSASGAPNPGFTGFATTGAGYVPVYASTIAVDVFIPVSTFISLTTTAAVGNATVTCGTIPPAGGVLHVVVNQYSGGSAVVTFGTGFRPNTTVTPASLKAIGVIFVSDGTNYIEFARSGTSV